ncbi:hypothetical protein CRUP_023372 [Coryphaenoides rupestris]|nr:hypothetical protein CRUP_023372 [Coryphaenoides rupestris]
MEEDILYHFSLGTKTHNLPEMFGDTKFVCVGGSAKRMKAFAQFIHQELGLPGSTDDLRDICEETDRYCMYKVGPVLSISHGMGVPSISIMMHELIKLLHHAQCCDVPQFEQVILGKVITRSTELDEGTSRELLRCSAELRDLPTIIGNTIVRCNNNVLYPPSPGQGRLDGCSLLLLPRGEAGVLAEAYEAGVRNIEMESTVFAAMCRMCNLKAAVICVTLLNRLRATRSPPLTTFLMEYQAEAPGPGGSTSSRNASDSSS